jgi:peptidoglycan/LPS O-acetylase OafA/YrhL
MIFRRDIEGLRCIAVLAVVGFHYGVPGIGGGFVGVDIFFVISGYLITGLLLQELDRHGEINLLRFYGRRARRLLPASLLVTVTTLICCIFIFSPLEQKVLAKAAFASSLYLSNLWFLYQAFAYFSPESTLNPFLHTWSLSVEEQFYLFWPALLLIGRSSDTRRIALIMISVTVVSFAVCIWMTSTKQPWAFFSLPTRAWEFGLGGLGCLVSSRRSRARFWYVVGCIALPALLATCSFHYSLSRFPGPDAVFAAGATACILISGATWNHRGPMRLLGTRPFQWVGERSYSIYLWHWPILVLATVAMTRLSFAGRVGCFCLTLLFAQASYRLVENPVRRSRWLSLGAVRSLGLGVTLTICGAAFALGEALVAKRFAATPFQALIADTTAQEPVASGGDGGCLVSFTDSRPLRCVFGEPESSTTVVLFGDSHADEWSTPFASIAVQNGWRLVTYLKSSCSIADIPVYNMRLHRFSPECAQWRSAAIAEIIRLRPVAVIIAEFSSGYIRGALTDLGENAVDLAAWSNGLNRTVETFHRAGIAVIELRDSPTPGRDMKNCLARADWHRQPLSSCETQRSEALDEGVTNAERAVSERIPSVAFVDLTVEICDSSTCPAVRDGIPVYRDANHLTASYAAHLAVPLASALTPYIGTRFH